MSQYKKISSLLSFPKPFLEVYTPLWLCSLVILVALDLSTKKWMTQNLNFYLGLHQAKWIPEQRADTSPLKAMAGSYFSDGKNQIDIWGDRGKYIKFRLVFNDRFVFGLGPARPLLGIVLSFLATCFLILYRWKNSQMGPSIAWLLVFSGALGNFIDKLFIKSLSTREWFFSLYPQKGYISGVVDFVECIWFGWGSLSDTFLLKFLAMETWPTFNLADSLIMVGIFILIFSIRKHPL